VGVILQQAAGKLMEWAGKLFHLQVGQGAFCFYEVCSGVSPWIGMSPYHGLK